MEAAPLSGGPHTCSRKYPQPVRTPRKAQRDVPNCKTQQTILAMIHEHYDTSAFTLSISPPVYENRQVYVFLFCYKDSYSISCNEVMKENGVKKITMSESAPQCVCVFFLLRRANFSTMSYRNQERAFA